MELAPMECPVDELPPKYRNLYCSGCVIALCAALDCFAGTIIGAWPLPQDILRADFRRLKNEVKVSECVAKVGPEGWLEWLLDFRDMLIHRGRRLQKSISIPREPDSCGPDWQSELRLPLEPGLSEVQAFRQLGGSNANISAMVLNEKAEVTLDGLEKSVVALIELIAEALVCRWKARQLSEIEMQQPTEKQWGSKSQRSRFQGYAPQPQASDGEMVGIADPDIEKRFRAAGLVDSSD
ncbi:MAG: hypothetical protein SFV18_01985 [Bryobacteraceae bacterium]|nr:hypothetical protein [Bryobacteraceae bacterium]